MHIFKKISSQTIRKTLAFFVFSVISFSYVYATIVEPNDITEKIKGSAISAGEFNMIIDALRDFKRDDNGTATLVDDKIGLFLPDGVDPVKNLDVNGTIKGTAFYGSGANLTDLPETYWTKDGDDINYGVGNVGIGIASPTTALQVIGTIKATNFVKTDGSAIGASPWTINGNYARRTTLTGYTDIGANNSSFSHFYTDRPNYFFNKGLIVDTGLLSSYNEDLTLATGNGTARMTILDSNGNVGIGLSVPAAELHVSKSQDSSTSILVGNSSTGAGANTKAEVRVKSDAAAMDFIVFGSNATGNMSGVAKADGAFVRTHTGKPVSRMVIGNGGDAPLYFVTDDTTQMTVLGNGNVGIGLTDPSSELEVAGDIEFSGTIKTAAGEIRCASGQVMVGFNASGLLCEVAPQLYQ